MGVGWRREKMELVMVEICMSKLAGAGLGLSSLSRRQRRIGVSYNRVINNRYNSHSIHSVGLLLEEFWSQMKIFPKLTPRGPKKLLKGCLVSRTFNRISTSLIYLSTRDFCSVDERREYNDFPFKFIACRFIILLFWS